MVPQGHGLWPHTSRNKKKINQKKLNKENNTVVYRMGTACDPIPRLLCRLGLFCCCFRALLTRFVQGHGLWPHTSTASVKMTRASVAGSLWSLFLKRKNVFFLQFSWRELASREDSSHTLFFHDEGVGVYTCDCSCRCVCVVTALVAYFFRTFLATH